MRRAVARGRLFPQGYSTDRRYGRLSLKAIALYPLMWSNADDQGRLCGIPEEIKYAVCPNVDHITKADIPGLLKELGDNDLIEVYKTPKSPAVQMLDWWDPKLGQKLQWAWPSEYAPPEGWQDHLRYKKNAKQVVTLNWPVSGEDSGESLDNTQVSNQVNDNTSSGESSGETDEVSPLTTPSYEKEKERGNRRGRGNSPERSGEKPSPSPTIIPTEQEILDRLKSCFKKEWGRVLAKRPDEIIPRKATARELAQLRDLAKELYAAGGCPLDYIDQAFREAAGQSKCHISYARAVLLDWLGIERNRSP